MSESNNNIPMRITQLEEATSYTDGMYYVVAKAGGGTQKMSVDTPTMIDKQNAEFNNKTMDALYGFRAIEYNQTNGFYYNNGINVSLTSNNAYHSTEISVEENEAYEISGAIPAVSGLAVVFLVDENKKNILALCKGDGETETKTYENIKVIIPNGVRYMLLSTIYGIKELSVKKINESMNVVSPTLETMIEGDGFIIKNNYAIGGINSSGEIITSTNTIYSTGYFLPSTGLDIILSSDIDVMPIRFTWYNNNWQVDSYPNSWYDRTSIKTYLELLPFQQNKRYKLMARFKDLHDIDNTELNNTKWNEKIKFIDGDIVTSAIDYYSREKIKELTALKPWQGKKILSLGDSYTYLNYYGKYLEQETGCEQRGRGWNGGYICYCVADQYSEGSGFIQEPFDATLLAPYDIVTVMAGTNNYGYGPSTLGNINDPIGTGLDSDSVYSQLKYVINKILTIKPYVQLVFVTQPYRLEFTNQPNGGRESNNRGFTMDDVANAIKEVCAYYYIPCFDFHSLGGWNEYTIGVPHQTHDFITNPYTYDGLHPRDGENNGAYWLGKKLGAFINSLK